MDIQCTVVGVVGHPTVDWPDGWPVPRVGDCVEFDGHSLYVRTVIWFPKGDDDSGPFVYVVIGMQR